MNIHVKNKETMRQIKAIFLSMMSLVLLTACPPDPDPVVESATFQRSLQVSADKGQQTYTATDLKAGISNVQNTSSWLTVTTLAYSSGSPTVQLTYEANTGDERQVLVTLTDVNNNKLFLTVTQMKAGETPVNPDQPDNPDNPDDPYVPQTYQQTASFDSWEAGSQIVKLTSLSSGVKEIEKENGTDWLAVEQESYSSGTPSVKLKAAANNDTQQRTAIATITAENGDKVILTVTQTGRTYGIDDPHDTESDQPAYSRSGGRAGL